MSLDTIRNYFSKNAFDDNCMLLLRQKTISKDSQLLDSKEYIVVDDAFIKSQFTMASSQDMKANWQAAFTFLPFK